jgi:hypothetical protein
MTDTSDIQAVVENPWMPWSPKLTSAEITEGALARLRNNLREYLERNKG